MYSGFARQSIHLFKLQCDELDGKVFHLQASRQGYVGPLEPIAKLNFSGDNDAGLLRSCLYCFHVTHISCWSSLNVPICPTGCGCICNGLEEMQTRPPSRHGLSPRPAPLLLPFA